MLHKNPSLFHILSKVNPETGIVKFDGSWAGMPSSVSEAPRRTKAVILETVGWILKDHLDYYNIFQTAVRNKRLIKNCLISFEEIEDYVVVTFDFMRFIGLGSEVLPHLTVDQKLAGLHNCYTFFKERLSQEQLGAYSEFKLKLVKNEIQVEFFSEFKKFPETCFYEGQRILEYINKDEIAYAYFVHLCKSMRRESVEYLPTFSLNELMTWPEISDFLLKFPEQPQPRKVLPLPP